MSLEVIEARMTTQFIRNAAEKELRDEKFRAAVEEEKARLRQRKWWHRLIPFELKLTIRRRT